MDHSIRCCVKLDHFLFIMIVSIGDADDIHSRGFSTE